MNVREVQGCLTCVITGHYGNYGKYMFKKLWEIFHFMSYNGVWEIFLEVNKNKEIKRHWVREMTTRYLRACAAPFMGPKFNS